MYTLSDTLHGCTIAHQPVLLDTAKGRYLTLRGDASRSLLDAVERQMPSAMEDMLRCHGLLAWDAKAQVRVHDAPVVTRSRREDLSQTVPGKRVMAALGKRLAARHHLRGRPFGETLQALRDAVAPKRSPARWRRSHGEAEIATAFACSRLWLAGDGRCVPDSLALASVLARHGHRPRIVIGVCLPIAAHCWVQCEDRLISDRLEAITPFHPIWST